LYPTIANFP
jgi:MFS transporter, PHS family, inorganic phosphate transporter